MCIRDSTITVEPGKTYKFIVESFNSFGDKTGEGSVAVSYTHLDVYKRQVRCGWYGC